MTAPVFGRVEHPEEINLDPFTFTLVGYRQMPDGEKREETFQFTASGVRPYYVQIDMTRAAAADNGVLAGKAIADYVELALVDDDERARFREVLETPDVYFEAGVLAEISNWLGETYSGRPTKRPTASRSGASRGGRRSAAAPSARGGAESAASRRGKR